MLACGSFAIPLVAASICIRLFQIEILNVDAARVAVPVVLAAAVLAIGTRYTICVRRTRVPFGRALAATLDE